MLISAGTLVPGDVVWRPGWVDVRGTKVVDAGPGAPARPPDVSLPDAVVVPGFVDMHVHGGGGFGYPTGSVREAIGAATFHRARGTTTTVASLVTDTLERLGTIVAEYADLVDDGVLAGLHLEGPWLSPARRGAHDASLLGAPSEPDVARLLEAGRGHVAMVTLAPELSGGMAAVARVVASGAVAAIGHTDADLATTRAAIDAGATVATHLFNGMPPLHHRAPGPVAALLDDPRVTVELIADGVHLDPAMLPVVRRTVGAGRIALVSDATAAAGKPDGRYRLGPLDVTVTDGVARVDGDGALAGGSATMADLFRLTLTADSGPGALLRVVAMTSGTPARALGLADVGRLAPGRSADLVVLDADHTVTAVLRRGAWVTGP